MEPLHKLLEIELAEHVGLFLVNRLDAGMQADLQDDQAQGKDVIAVSDSAYEKERGLSCLSLPVDRFW